MVDTYNEKSLTKFYLKLQSLEKVLESESVTDNIDCSKKIDTIHIVLVEIIKVVQGIIRTIHIKT